MLEWNTRIAHINLNDFQALLMLIEQQHQRFLDCFVQLNHINVLQNLVLLT